jgi:hypothetical protein
MEERRKDVGGRIHETGCRRQEGGGRRVERRRREGKTFVSLCSMNHTAGQSFSIFSAEYLQLNNSCKLEYCKYDLVY